MSILRGSHGDTSSAQFVITILLIMYVKTPLVVFRYCPFSSCHLLPLSKRSSIAMIQIRTAVETCSFYFLLHRSFPQGHSRIRSRNRRLLVFETLGLLLSNRLILLIIRTDTLQLNTSGAVFADCIPPLTWSGHFLCVNRLLLCRYKSYKSLSVDKVRNSACRSFKIFRKRD